MNKDDEIKALKAKVKKLEADYKVCTQLLWDNGLSQAEFLDNVREKRQIAQDKLDVVNANKDTTLRDTAEAHIAYFEWLAKQYMRKGKGMSEKDAKNKAREDTADLVEAITGKRPGQTLRYGVYPPPRNKIS